MITTCTECQARYQLDDEKIPRRKIRVRCPACHGVFALDGTRAGSAKVDTPAMSGPVAETSEGNSAGNDELIVSNGFDTSFAPETPAAEAPGSAAAQPESGAEQVSVAVLDEAAASTGASRRRRSKEEMLARALVSDILVYNREQRDKALAEGNLLEALGAEIKKSWELYKEKVTPEVANSTNHFREALNEILAEGEKVF